ncbi:hypothetical protein [Flavobacterium subsaxonicum]|uniref:Uncharacterized protein n=1 Tax=Flavobacterium subsaxonicum WB 4.1-42 = DSM 21790 TaxID=1121898 RepID=A0A0A2MM22_9FLAO|nr:hypothetical protein [Flavobacterium subsaxonicum]KGO92626.1 hypothetical protein Q766_10900 [Flavobacterium subsaxonicum WB 4.1-42 = DSM 21790]
MKKILLLSLLGISLYACSNEEAADTAVSQKTVAEPVAAPLQPEVTAILNRYIVNQGSSGNDEATKTFAADAKIYLTDKGIATTGLNDSEVINLFLSNI